jgi:hypothetical protein
MAHTLMEVLYVSSLHRWPKKQICKSGHDQQIPEILFVRLPSGLFVEPLDIIPCLSSLSNVRFPGTWTTGGEWQRSSESLVMFGSPRLLSLE